MVTGIVDHTRDAHGVVCARLLDLVPGPSGKAYADWLKCRDIAFTAGIKTAGLDPFRGCANAIRDELPEAITVLDTFHVVKLGSAMVDEVRRRVQQDTLGHRGRKGDPLYGIRRTLLIGPEHLSEKQSARLDAKLSIGDPRHEVTLAWPSLGLEIKLLPPRDPESKGIVEGMNRFFRRRFMPGRDFRSPADFNGQLEDWLPKANHRYSRSRHGRPDELIVLDRERMRELPPVSPVAVFGNAVRLPRDHYVPVFSNDHSVDPSFIGRIVDVTADLDTIWGTHDGVIIATHVRHGPGIWS